MRIILIVLSFLLPGCTGLLILEDDPVHLVATKVVWRTVLGVSTLGVSELQLADLRHELQQQPSLEQRLDDYQSHLTYLVNNGYLTQQQAEELYQRYASALIQEERDRSLAQTGSTAVMVVNPYSSTYIPVGRFSSSAPRSWYWTSPHRSSSLWRYRNTNPRLQSPHWPRSKGYARAARRR